MVAARVAAIPTILDCSCRVYLELVPCILPTGTTSAVSDFVCVAPQCSQNFAPRLISSPQATHFAFVGVCVAPQNSQNLAPSFIFLPQLEQNMVCTSLCNDSIN